MNYQNTNDHDTNDVLTEGIISDTLKAVADVDVNAIKNEWINSKGLNDKLGIINDNGIEKAKNGLGAVDNILKNYSADTRSIITRAKNSVLQFPIYVTQTLRVNEAQIIAKLFERVYTTLVQTVLSHNQILSEEEANDLVFLKRFHTNLKEAADVLVNEYYNPIDEVDSILKESVFLSQKISDNCLLEFRYVPCTDKDLILENARLMHEPLTGLIYLREANEESTTTTTKILVLSNNEIEDIIANNSDLSEEEKRLARMSATEIRKQVESEKGNKSKDINLIVKNRLNAAKNAREKLDVEIEETKKRAKELSQEINSSSFKNLNPKEQKKLLAEEKKLGIIYRSGKFCRADATTTTSTKETTHAIDAPKLLHDSDIKKINGMLPYSIEASFSIKTKDGITRDVKYIIGIKSVMHLIRTQDLVEDLPELITGNIKTLQKVRYKTGEITFKDYFFNIKSLKADAAKNINYNKRWINTLKRLSDYKDMHGGLMKHAIQGINKGSVPIPNGTLILAQPDVTMLTNQTGIDLSKVSNAKRLARSLFLIGVVIVDSSAGVMRVLFPDSDTDWDVQSLSAIDAELSKTDNSQLMKELNRMVNR